MFDTSEKQIIEINSSSQSNHERQKGSVTTSYFFIASKKFVSPSPQLPHTINFLLYLLASFCVTLFLSCVCRNLNDVVCGYIEVLEVNTAQQPVMITDGPRE